MAKMPDERYQNGEDIIKALNDISDEELTLINTEFTKEGHRDSGENINYSVSTPISNSGLTKVQRNNLNNDNQDDETRIINLTPTNLPNEKKNKRTLMIVAITITLLVIAGTGDYLNRGVDSFIANLLSGKNKATKENEDKLNALLKSTQLIEQQLLDNKKLEAEKLAKKEKEDAITQSKLLVLLEKANGQEQQLTFNNEIIDELFQTYQLISLIENEHPKVVQGLENIKNVYLAMIEEQLLNQNLLSATKTLQKKLRLFPELEDAAHILSIKTKINTLSQVTELLTKAETHLADNKLSGSDDNNAHALYNQVLTIDPNNEVAKKGKVNISEKYHNIANELAKNKQYQQALTYIELGKNIHPESSAKFSVLREDINQKINENEKFKAKQQQIEQQLSDGIAQEKMGNLVSSSGQSALTLYRGVLTLEPKNETALNAISNIEKKYLSVIPSQLSALKFAKAQKTITTALSYFPASKLAKSQQQKLNTAIKQYKASQKPKISNLIIKGQDFTKMVKQSSNKLKADRTIYIGFEYTNFGKRTKVLQAILYAGSRSDKLSTTPVIITKDSGVKYFKISRPVAGFAEGGYYLDFMQKSERVATHKFSIEN